MASTNLNTVISPQGVMNGLMPPRHVGRRIGMPSTVKRPFSPRGLAGTSPSLPSLGPRPPRGGLSALRPQLAMGGSVDFENVLGQAGSIPQAIQMFGSPMRLAEGGQVSQDDLMARVGNLLHRVHKVWHEHMCKGGLIERYAQGGYADGGEPHGQLRALREKSGTKRTLQDALHDILGMGGIEEPSDAAPYLAYKNWFLPTPASAAASLGLYSGDAGAADEWAMMPRDYMDKMRAHYRDRGLSVPRRYMEPLDSITGAMAPRDPGFGDLPSSLQSRVAGGNPAAWNLPPQY